MLAGESGLLLGLFCWSQGLATEPKCPKATPYAPVPEDLAGKYSGKALGYSHMTQWGKVSFTVCGNFPQRSSLIPCVFIFLLNIIIEIWERRQLMTLVSCFINNLFYSCLLLFFHPRSSVGFVILYYAQIWSSNVNRNSAEIDSYFLCCLHLNMGIVL